MARRGPPPKGRKGAKAAMRRAAPRARVASGPPRDALPSVAEIRAFLATADGRVGKTEIARHFGIPTELRPALRQRLSEMKAAGSAAPVGKKTFRAPERLPDTAVVEVTGTDPDGDPIARPVEWGGEGRPVIYMHPERRGIAALAPGERVLARLRHV